MRRNAIWRLGFRAICRQKDAVLTLSRLSRPLRPRVLVRSAAIPLLALAGFGTATLVAQMEGERGVPPIASSGDFEVGKVEVDAYAENPDAARTAAWRQAQRQAWKMLWARTNGGTAPALSDGQLDRIISGIEIESEEIGPNRYIGRLRVLFDRARAGQILGVRRSAMRSPPLLVVPILREGGVSTVFETVNEWQKAWARYRTGDSAIDYVRTSGTGPDALLLDAGQIGRRGRNWWRNILDQYGAADVLFPVVRLEREGPGGAVTGRFAARYGPDNRLIGAFTLRVNNAAGIPKMLDEGIGRINDLYTRALLGGSLRPDTSLVIEEPLDDSDLPTQSADDAVLESGAEATPEAQPATSFSLHVETPDAATVGQIEAALRGVPGVRSAATSSLAPGGVSVMQLTFEGSSEMLKTALQARGFSVSGSGSTLRISRRGGAASAGNP